MRVEGRVYGRALAAGLLPPATPLIPPSGFHHKAEESPMGKAVGDDDRDHHFTGPAPGGGGDGCGSGLGHGGGGPAHSSTHNLPRKRGRPCTGDRADRGNSGKRFPGEVPPPVTKKHGNTNFEDLLENNVDHSHFFATNQAFRNRDELVDWAKDVAKKHKQYLVIMRSHPGDEGRRGKVWLGCERSGKHRIATEANGSKERSGGTKKCQCPFLLKGVVQDSGHWKLHVLNGEHNHDVTKRFNGGRSIALRLSEEDYQLIWEMTKANAKPKEILEKLTRADGENKRTLLRHIYNARQKFRMEEMSDRLFLLERFMKQITGHDYRTWVRKDPVTGNLNDLLFAHERSLVLLHEYPYVLAVYCSCKKNRMPFLEIVGFTSTYKSFSAVFALLSVDLPDNYVWALQSVRELFKSNSLPVAVITSRDPTLVEAVETVFPETRHLLWRNQVRKDIERKCSKMTDNQGITAEFMKSWKRLVEAKDEARYEDQLCFLELDYGNLPDILSYVKETWLIPCKEKIVSAWTDHVTHFGIHMLSRVDSVHSRLKQFLGSPTSSFDTMWAELHSIVELQLKEIEGAFEASRTNVPHAVILRELYSHLRSHVSHKGLELIVSETKKVMDVGSNAMICGCYLRCTHGLPCAHELSAHFIPHVDAIIPLSEIHPFWKLVDFKFSNLHDVMDHDAYLECFIQVFKSKPQEEQKRLVGCLDELINPRPITSDEPSLCQTKQRAEVDTEDDPSACEYLKELSQSMSSPSLRSIAGSSSYSSHEPEQSLSEHSVESIQFPFPGDIEPFMVSHIRSWTEVEVDGNCRYRSVATILGMGEIGWHRVLQDCFYEVNARRYIYEKVLGLSSVQTMLDGFSHWDGSCRKSQRMPSPDIGYVLATRYQVVVVILSKVQSLTFLPLVATDNHEPLKRVIALAHLASKDCFVALELHEGAPIPPLMSSWHSLHDASVDGWDSAFHERFQEYIKLRKEQRP